MPRDIEPISQNKHGDDVHPAFGMAQVSRWSSTPGSVLFDSDIRHGRTVVLSITTATRKRDLNRDWIHPGKQVVEVEMSEAQWASLVSSIGTSGVPVTLRAAEGNPMLPGLEYDPRLAHSMDEVKQAAEKTFGKIKAAMAAVDALDPKAPVKERRAAMQSLQIAIEHAEGNLEFASKSLTEHAENVVQRSRADIEAMAYHAAQAMGLPEGTRLLQIDAVPEED